MMAKPLLHVGTLLAKLNALPSQETKQLHINPQIYVPGLLACF